MVTKLKKIIAIGGGEIGRPKPDGSGYYPVQTSTIDREILRLTDKKSASLLFIPTASDDSQDYFELVKKHFLKIGFNSVNSLPLLGQAPSRAHIKNTLLSHDAIYVGGGDTFKMMEVWKQHDLGALLKTALDQGVVLSGLSAGSICWFDKGTSDLAVGSSGNKELAFVDGLGFISAVNCPHFNTEPKRQNDIKNKLMGTSEVAVCLDDCAALEVVGSSYRVIKSKVGAKARLAFWKKGSYYVEEITASQDFKSLEDLLVKRTR